MLTNLLTNAAKYTPPGGLITLEYRFEANRLIIYVRDNGVGLAPEMLSRVFTMFTRIESPQVRSEGLGIGLALSKGLVELHGGRIEARSEGLGKGSEFVISLPKSLVLDQVPPPHLRQSAELGSARRRILIADDNQDAAETMRMLLEHGGHDVHVVNSGGQALRMIKETRAQVAILDIGMSDMSGYDVAERVRSEAWGKDIRLIAVTGWGQDEDKRRAKAAGFDHHLTKPIDAESLGSLINE